MPQHNRKSVQWKLHFEIPGILRSRDKVQHLPTQAALASFFLTMGHLLLKSSVLS